MRKKSQKCPTCLTITLSVTRPATMTMMTKQEEEDKEAKPQLARQRQASKDYWLLSEAEVAKNAMKERLRDKSCRLEPGDFELIRLTRMLILTKAKF